MNKTLAEITAELVSRQKAQIEQRQIAILNTASGAEAFFKSQDMKTLKAVTAIIESAYDKPLQAGFQFNEVIETIVAIARALQYAKKDVRELMQPSDANSLDIYALFDRDTRDILLDAYGSLPYMREATVLAMPDGSTQVLDADLVADASKGKPVNVDLLNSVLEQIALKLGLLGTYTVTQEKADAEFKLAQRRVASLAKLNEYKSALQA